jgi:hypothetical protein
MVWNSLIRQSVVAAALVSLLSAEPAAMAEPQLLPAGDFGFRFEVGDCLTEIFDSFSGLFTKNLGGDPARSVTAQFTLTDSQMRTIYQTIEQIRFFELASPFTGVQAGLNEVITISPSRRYRLEVRNGGVVHTVVWTDGTKPTTEQADRLRALFSMIIGFIHDHPDFKRLPPPLGGCA